MKILLALLLVAIPIIAIKCYQGNYGAMTGDDREKISVVDCPIACFAQRGIDLHDNTTAVGILKCAREACNRRYNVTKNYVYECCTENLCNKAGKFNVPRA